MNPLTTMRLSSYHIKEILKRNGVHYDMRKPRTLLILSLGGYLLTLHNNMPDISAGWETEDFEQLEVFARQYLVTVINNGA